MRQVTRKGLITMAAAGGVLALSGGYAHADAGAAGSASKSPGVLSGNSVQIPVDVPVNVCGNSVSIGGLLNPAAGNDCGNGPADTGRDAGPYDNAPGGDSSGGRPAEGHTADGDKGTSSTQGTGRHRGPAATAEGEATGSPGIGSGNHVAVPIDIPVNVCGNSVTIGGLLNPVFGNDCGNDPEVSPPTDHPETPTTPEKPADPVHPPVSGPSEPNAPGPQLLPEEQLAQTGAGGLDLLIPASAGLLLAGAGTVLYRRSRSAA
ncbi:chaplin [Streptomyces sp. NPDC048560]|uniref:chaplin n=1 Tax=Streptomyces sp. NPDC048560 TaxID=3155488 RepID=UPI003420C0DC